MKFLYKVNVFLLVLSFFVSANGAAVPCQTATPPSCLRECTDISHKEFDSECYELQTYYYLLFGISRLSFKEGDSIGPSVHVGRRYEMEEACVDLSFNWSQSESSKDGGTNVFLSAPRIGYLLYGAPTLSGSLVFGPALSWTVLKESAENDEDKSEFSGVALEGILGYEFHRNGKIRALVQLDVCQPLLSSGYAGGRLPNPVVSLSFGAGF